MEVVVAGTALSSYASPRKFPVLTYAMLLPGPDVLPVVRRGVFRGAHDGMRAYPRISRAICAYPMRCIAVFLFGP
eukprot:3744824-Rhodomonas_salina.4